MLPESNINLIAYKSEDDKNEYHDNDDGDLCSSLATEMEIWRFGMEICVEVGQVQH